MADASTHKYVGDHAAEVAGVMRAPGETFVLSDEQVEDPSMQDYINSGAVMDLSAKGGDK